MPTAPRNPVRTRRINAGLTQAEVAERAGLDQSTVSDIETGRRHGLPNTLKALADVFGCQVTDLLDDGGES